MNEAPQLSLPEAQAILAAFNCLETRPIESAEEKSRVQAAVQTVVQACDYPILGILADSIEQGLLTLQTYAAVIGLDLPPAPEAPVGPVYLKLNPRSGRCYCDRYTGEYRGVLLSCQSDFADGLNEMYGHLPLDLFD